MSDHRFALSVALAPGTGLIGRREQTLLFVPRPDDRVKVLLDAFTHGPVDEVWERLAEAVLDQDFDVCAFSCIAAEEQIEIRVFGDLELTTDLRSVPMLSGAASGTWVEHRVPGHPRSASITTASDGVDERTGLVDGIVHAGGFTAALVEQRAHTLDTIQIPATNESISIPAVTPPVVGLEADTSTIDHDDSSELMSYVDRLADEATDESTGDMVDGMVDGMVDELVDDLDVENTHELVESTPDITLDPVAVRDLVAPDAPTLAARVCKAGHANAPGRTTCDVCEVFLPAGPDGVRLVLRPSLGTLILDDGRRIDLLADVMIGRNPSRNGDNWIPVVIEGERISRTHLTVRCSAWDVMVDDAGSHNGTVVIPSDGSQPVALVAGTPHLIEPGATAYFGSSSFRFEGRRGSSDQ